MDKTFCRSNMKEKHSPELNQLKMKIIPGKSEFLIRRIYYRAKRVVSTDNSQFHREYLISFNAILII